MGIKDSSLWAREILSFLETAKNGSINGTAEANAMKQSNLSRTLKSLEEKLKCQLLERGYNGVRLTENGREVFKVACDLDKVIYKVKNFTISDKNVSGKIRLWTSDGLGTGYLSNCLSEFIAKYPDVKIEVVCSLDTPGSFSTTDMAVVYEEPENVTDCRRRFNCYRRCRSENGFLVLPFEPREIFIDILSYRQVC